MIGVRPDDEDQMIPSLFPSPVTSSRPLSESSDHVSSSRRRDVSSSSGDSPEPMGPLDQMSSVAAAGGGDSDSHHSASSLPPPLRIQLPDAGVNVCTFYLTRY